MWLPLMHPLLGTWPTTQACALTGNRTSDPLVLRPALNPLSYTSQGRCYLLKDLNYRFFFLLFPALSLFLLSSVCFNLFFIMQALLKCPFMLIMDKALQFDACTKNKRLEALYDGWGSMTNRF